MSKAAKKLQKEVLIKQRHNAVKELAEKYGWAYANGDKNTYKVCYIDRMGIYRADIYLSTLTIGLLPIETGQDMIWFKKIGYDKLEEILKEPIKYEIE